MTEPKQRIVIAGGGLAGALLALVLANQSFKVTVLEKRGDLRAEKAAGGRSINLALSERGIRALDKVGLAEKALEQTIPMRGRLIHDTSGNTNFQPYSQNAGEFIRSISRPGLNRLLLSEASKNPNIDLIFDAQVESISDDIHYTDNTGTPQSLPFDILIGADGAGSVIRKELGIEALPGYSQDMLAHGYKELEMPAIDLGKAFPAVNSATGTASPSSTAFAMEKEALHIWPRGTYMLIALPNLDGSFTCTLFLPLEGQPGFNQLLSPEAVRAFFEEQFPDVLQHLPGLEAEFFANPVGKLGTIRCPEWSDNKRTLILGDAAHAVVPFFGQGMNCAFEDVSVFADMLDALRSPSNSIDRPLSVEWPAFFKEFQSSRIANANAIADMALENYIEMRDLVADDAYRLRRQVALELEKRYPDRFRPRYSMVSFSTIPYKTVQEIGEKQNRILHELCSPVMAFNDIDWALAERLVNKLDVL